MTKRKLGEQQLKQLKEASAKFAQKKLAHDECSKGHKYIKGSFFMGVSGGRPFRKCLVCQSIRRTSPEGRARTNAAKMTETKAQQVLLALQDGMSLNQITSGIRGHTYVGQKITRRAHFYNYCRDNSRYAKLVKKLRADNEKRWGTRWGRPRSRLVSAPVILHNNGEAVLAIVSRAVASLPEHLRAEVQSNMVLAVYEGRLALRDVERRTDEFKAQHTRMFSQFVPVIGGYMASLDAPIHEDGSTTRIERVTEGLWA